MVQISSPNGISQEMIGELERFFPTTNTVFNTTDFRRIDNSIATRYIADQNNIYIIDRALLDGFVNARYDEITSFKIGREEIQFPLTKAIQFDSMTEGTDPEIITFRDDDGKYIAQRQANIILLSIPLELFPTIGLRKVFDKIGLHRMSDEEYIAQKLKTLVMKGMENSLADTTSRLSKATEGMNNAYSSWVSQYQAYNNMKRQLEGITKFDMERENNLALQLKRLFRSRYVESIEMHGTSLVLVTKPLDIGIWKIGQYTITYALGSVYPSMKRLSVPSHNHDVPIDNNTKFHKIMNPATHCNVDGMPCSGNYSDMLKAFWMSDMLTGFNSAVKFIKSYSKSSGPYVDFEVWLTDMGYFEDATILIKNGRIETVDNGVLYMKSNPEIALSDDDIKRMGCTGKPTDPDRWEKLLEGTEAMNREGLAHSLEYVDTTQP